MAREVSGHTAAMLAAAQRRGVRRGLLALAGACVLLVTVWALVLPGVTMANATFCGQEEHKHSTACYQQVLTCGFDDGSEGGSAASSGEFSSSVSDAADGEQSASAGSGAAGEGQGEGSTAASSGAVNSPDEDSFARGSSPDSSASSAQGASSAASESVASAAADTNAANAANAASAANAATPDAPADAAVVSLVSDAVAAELPASSSAASSSGHVHSEACYESVLVCEVSEHEHSLACYSDSSADLETEAAWEATLPADDDMTGNWAADVLAVADSQLGYKESTANYSVVENAAGTEVAKGYTRYGAWWGDAYGDWCAMFASFCLSYAGVPEEVVPQDANCQNWIEALSAEGVWLWRPVEAVENAEGAAQRTGIAVVPAEAVAAWEAEAAELAELAGETAGGDVASTDTSGESASANAGVDAAAADFSAAEGEDASGASLEAALLGGSSARYTALGSLIYDPQPGDLVFFDWDNDGETDHVGFVYELLDADGSVVAEAGDASGLETASSSVVAEGASDGDGSDSANGDAANDAVGSSAVAVKLKTIEGNVSDGSADTVRYKEYDLTDSSIFGYASLPEAPESQALLVSEGDESEVSDDESSALSSSSGIGETMIHNGGLSKWHYEESEHEMAEKSGSHSLITFILAPADDVEAVGGSANWEANTVDWTAKSADANYIVVYCADVDTFTGYGNDGYVTYTLDNSRFTSEEQRCVLAGIIGHSYPYITADDMSSQILAAYDRGEFPEGMNRENLALCNENEFIAATQWAIWETTMMGRSFDGLISEEDEPWGIKEAPESYFENGELASPYAKAIKDWLVSQYEIGDLAVDDYDYETVYDADSDTYTLSVGVCLNRGVRTGEAAAYSLIAGEKSSGEKTIDVDAESFKVELGGLTRDELTQARVSLSVEGEHMQAYFFDSPVDQDFIGGRWESYSDDLSFSVGVEGIDVSVAKRWAEGDEAENPGISVQLYANGVKCGDPVILNEGNNWSYVWRNMVLKDADGGVVSYTVEEVPVDGYRSIIGSFYGDVAEVDGWSLLSKGQSLVEESEYLLYSNYLNLNEVQVSNGALARESDSGGDLSWLRVDKTDYPTAPASAKWHVKPADGGGFYLYLLDEEGLPSYLCVYSSSSSEVDIRLLSSDSSPCALFSYDSDGHLVCENGGVSHYVAQINKSGSLVALAGADGKPNDYAISFDVYEKKRVELAQKDVSFVITNASISEDDVASVSVKKSWYGRSNSLYPESVSISLLADGEATGSTVTLSEKNDWSYTWYNLSLKNEDGSDIGYSIEEKVPEGYRSEVECSRAEDGSWNFDVSNIWKDAKLNLGIKKIDSKDGGVLAGASFDLYLVVGESDDGDVEVIGDDFAKRVSSGLATSQSGLAFVEGLDLASEYYLVETKAPDGYNTLENPIKFSVDLEGKVSVLGDGDLQFDWASVDSSGAAPLIVVKNGPGYELPETGGSGALVCVLAGCALVFAALLGLRRFGVFDRST